MKMAAAVMLLVSTGRALIEPRYHATTPEPMDPLLLVVGAKAGVKREDSTGEEGGGGGGGGSGAEGGLVEWRWERKWDQGALELGLLRMGRKTRLPAWRAPAAAMATAAAGLAFSVAVRCLQGLEGLGLGREERRRGKRPRSLNKSHAIPNRKLFFFLLIITTIILLTSIVFRVFSYSTSIIK